MSRTAWYIVSLTVVGLLVLPSLTERWRAVRRAVGTVAVFWVSVNLWATGSYLLGLSARVPRGIEIVWVLLPPVLVAAAWRAWDGRRRRRA